MTCMRRALCTGVIVVALLAVAPVGAGARSTAVNCPSDSLQAAIDAASTGDTLEVSGTCTGSFSVPGTGSATTLRIEGTPHATIDADHSGTALGATGVHLSLRDLRITNGSATFGGGVNVQGGSLRVVGSAIAQNDACAGGGVYLLGATGKLFGSSVRKNRGGHGPGACPFITGGGIEADEGSALELHGSTLAGNRAPAGVGGGVDLFAADGRINRSLVTGNRAGIAAGGISDQYGSTLEVHRSTIRSNVARKRSGGGMSVDGASALVKDSTFSNNRAGLGGGAILNFSDVADDPNGVTGNSHLSLRNSRISKNRAPEGGGGILNYASNAARVNGGEHGTVARLHLERTVIRRNRSPGGAGGGIWNVEDPGGEATTLLTRSFVHRNAAKRGGGITNNLAEPVKPMGGFSRVIITKLSRISSNVASRAGGGVFNGPDASILIDRSSDLRRNLPDNCHGC